MGFLSLALSLPLGISNVSRSLMSWWCLAVRPNDGLPLVAIMPVVVTTALPATLDEKHILLLLLLASLVTSACTLSLAVAHAFAIRFENSFGFFDSRF